MIELNYFAVLGAAFASMAIGMLWYGPVFGNTWKQLMGITDESMKSMSMTPMRAMLLGFASNLVMACVLSYSLAFANAFLGTSGLSAGLMAGFWSWLGFVAPVQLGSVLWEGKSWQLWFLNASYQLVALAVMGAILAAMG